MLLLALFEPRRKIGAIMKRRNLVLRVGLTLSCLILCAPLKALAASAPDIAAPAGLSIAEIKVTGSEFIVLQNNTGADITDLSGYALYYFNNFNPFAGGVSSSVSFLPATSLASGESLLLSSDPQQTCGATVAGDLGISLGDASGFLEIVKLSGSNGAVVQQAGDVVSWSPGANGLIPNVPSSTKDPAAMWYRFQNPDSSFGWQYADIDASNSCQLNAVITSGTTKTSVPTDGMLVDSGDTVPGTIVSLATTVGGGGTAGMPVADIGLKSPKMSELLPNVASPGSDSTDEFIELYNPNQRSFDLSGFTLQTGSTTSTTRHNYVFPAGTTIPGRGFKAFYSRQTGLSLSNTGGQAWLLDPFGTAITQSEPYSKPKDGIAWATVGGRWYYTTTPTPGAANSVKVPVSAGAKTSKSTAKTSMGTAVTALNASGSAAYSSGGSGADAQQTVPLHPMALAAVVAAALLYGAYEYRRDIANRIYELRENRRARAEARQ
jgi:hypothetical protein